ncbi:hypothetical protein PMAYCL1PPCAC_12097, partial [Pristionchus mayeri]
SFFSYRNAPMIRSICLFPLLFIQGTADSFLRLCPQDAPIDPSLIPDCVARASRQELRELTDEERTWVVDAFRKERAVAPRQKWENILDPPGVYQLIQRLDTRLFSRHLSLPYWDTSIELRLNHPGDSMLFHPSFLLRSRRRRDRRLNPLVRPKTRFERRIRNPRDDKATRRLQSQRTRKLLKAIRRDKQSELLFLLFEMGDLFTRISSPIVCPSSSPHISCSSNSSSPFPKLSPSARCSESLPEDICYKSHCIADLCTVVIESPIPTVPRTTVIPTTTVVETTVSGWNETETDNSTHVDLSSVEGVSTLSDEVTLLLSSHEITTTTTPVSVPLKRHRQNGWYRYKPKMRESTTTSAPKKREKVVRQAPENSEEDLPSPSFVFGSSGKKNHLSEFVPERNDSKFESINQSDQGKPIERSKHDEMESSLMLQSQSSFPQVFIPITVIEGPWRGPHRLKQVHDVTVLTTGLNLPIGYTSMTAGVQVNSSIGTFIVSVPNPELSGPVVEFNIIVSNKATKRCDQFCLNHKSGSYKPCTRNTLKISQYTDFSDPVHWSKSKTEAISSEWMGTGYYRRRRLTQLLFSCSPTD